MKTFDKESLKKKVGLMAIISAVIIVALLSFWFFAGRVKTDAGSESMHVTGIVRGYTIGYDQVTSVKLLSHFNTGKGKLLRSVETYATDNGEYESDAYGEYRLDIYRNVSRYIVVTTPDGTFVLNAKSPKATEALYRALCESVRDAGGSV